MMPNTTSVTKCIRGAAAAVALGLCGLPIATTGATFAQEPAFHGGVDLVVLHVAVTDKTGKQAADLEPADFSVFEDNRKQDIAFFQKADVPLAVTMLLDVSDSMALCLDIAQKAAIAFLRTLGPADVASVIPFERRMRDPLPFTNDRSLVEQAIRRMKANGTTALYDTVYIALKELRQVSLTSGSPLPQRQAILLLTDGIDSASLMSLDDMLEAASRSDAAIYVVRLPASANARIFATRPEFVLNRLAQQTGGRVYLSEEPSQLAGIFGQIKAELSGQYLLAFRPQAPRDGRFHQIAIRMERAGLSARTRPGYVAITTTNE